MCLFFYHWEYLEVWFTTGNFDTKTIKFKNGEEMKQRWKFMWSEYVTYIGSRPMGPNREENWIQDCIARV